MGKVYSLQLLLDKLPTFVSLATIFFKAALKFPETRNTFQDHIRSLTDFTHILSYAH